MNDLTVTSPEPNHDVAPVVEGVDDAEFAPIPDGGLSGALPTWLRQAPSRPILESATGEVDVASIAGSLVLPDWLAALSDRVSRTNATAATSPRSPEVVATGETVAIEPAMPPTEVVTTDAPVAEPVEVVANVDSASPDTAPSFGTVESADIDAEPRAGRPLGSTIIHTQQLAEERSRHQEKLEMPPIPVATMVDAEAFLRGAEVVVAPEPRVRWPFILLALLLIAVAAGVVIYLGA